LQIVYTKLSNYITYFVAYRVPFDKSRDLIIQYCKEFELDKARMHLLLGDLESL